MSGKKKNNVPKLRFSGFEEEWKQERIGEYLEEFKERVPADTMLPILTSSRTGLFFQKDYFNNRELKNEGEYGVVPKGYFTYRLMSDDSTFKFNINNLVDKGAISKEYPVFTTNDMDSKFLLEKLNHGREFKVFAIMQKRGGTRVRLYFNRLVELRLNLPSLPEQKKIATFLTAVDTRLQQLTRKKELLEEYKKGVMQKLFSRTVRFKDEEGNDFPEWEEMQLGEVFSFHKTNSFSRSLLNHEHENVKNIHYGDIHTKFKTNFDIENEEVPSVNMGIDLSKISKEDYCKIGDIVIADASEDYADIGKAIEIRNIGSKKLISGLHTHLLRCKNQYAVGFFGYLFQARNVRLQIMKMATGVSVLGISKTNLSKINIAYPIVAEQQKIATFLTVLDKKIDQVDRQVEEMGAWKKGLLQQLFV